MRWRRVSAGRTMANTSGSAMASSIPSLPFFGLPRRGDAPAADHADAVATVSDATGLPPLAAENAIAGFELTLDALILVDARRRILYANAGASELTGYASGEIVGQAC